ncbi:MAG TPA: NAD(P)-dependent oxidoreductase [Saprospirales bacterium]|nr:NAD(P)-dependent oxidoreductase [Saprospirales bacterium]HAY71176.1 NAD(P)-dependent oxidoreductase [Saprospirales bacterium]HRQ29286.1 SDR family NAD(P)-dependent oxidoreductase [Saprospiraceae bacterium]
MNQIVFLTGATSGIGQATAYHFASKGYDVILAGRRVERLNETAAEIQNKYKVNTLALELDVRDRQAVSDSLNHLEEKWAEISILVNNAGLASGFDFIQDGHIDDWDQMIDTNIKGLLYISKAVIPGMIRRGKGHIINIGSTAGKEVYAKGNVYCASKHAVDAITKGMRIDLLGTGIKVTQIAPGAAETEFSLVRFHGDAEQAKKVYKGFQPMTPEDIAEVIFYTTTLPEHLCINDLVLTSVAQANSFYIHREA